MTVAELKKELEKYPDSMNVFVAPRVTEFTYGLVNSIESKEIDFYEDEYEGLPAKETVVIIDEQ